jgi:hypothetical protein
MMLVGRRLAAAERKDWLVKPVETDPDSGAQIFQLTNDERPTDNIYGEQPYSPRQGNRIAVQHAASGQRDGGISIVDLTDGSVHPVVASKPRFPAFHAWRDHLYYQETVGDKLILRRCHYQTLAKEDVMELPAMEGRFSYGTVSQDHRYYAISFHPAGGGSKVLLFDLKTGQRRTLVERADFLFKHEQFSRDGRNCVLIQANKMPDVKEVRLGALDVDREGVRWFPADRPHTPRPTGHEAWVGKSSRILFSTASDKDSQGNVWTSALGDSTAALTAKTPTRFNHVSVSQCGQFWIGDITSEKDVPVHAGSLKDGRHLRLAFSRTVHDGKQWSHTHPYLTADNRWLIFNSTRSGRAQVYGARLAAGFLERVLVA